MRKIMPSTHLLNRDSMRTTAFSKVKKNKKKKKKGMGYANKKKNGAIKACSKAWFGHMQVRRKKEREKEITHIQKKKRGESHKKIHKISTHLHIMIRLHDLFLLGSSF
jgi:hypothetical protein